MAHELSHQFAGHSTPTLTMHYSHRRLHDLASAVGKLPTFLPDAKGKPEKGFSERLEPTMREQLVAAKTSWRFRVGKRQLW